MEEQEDEVGITTMESSTTSSWWPAEGTLNQSVKVVEESEDAIYTAGPTSRLVLVAPSPSSPSLSSSPSSAEQEPCELTVTFKQRHGHIHQIYVLSTARICEIYGQKEEDGDRDYVCTVRGGIISLSDDDNSADDASNVSLDATVEEELTRGGANSNATSGVPSAIPELGSAACVQQENSLSEILSQESVILGKLDSSQPGDELPSFTRRDSEEDLFRSFTEATNARAVEGSVIFEESLDHADWVECPHSPMKSAPSTTDDEAEVDVTNSGFYFIDSDSEAQQGDHPQVCVFTDAIRDAGKNSANPSLESGDTGSSGHFSWQEAIEESRFQNEFTDDTVSRPSTFEPNLEETQQAEESFESPRAHVNQFADDFIGENLPKSGFCDFEVNEERDSSSPGTPKSPAVNAIPKTLDSSVQGAETSISETLAEKNGDVESRFSVEAPVYECEVGLVDADAWTSLTIRLLSIKTKSQVEIHRVVVTYIPGPPIQPPVIDNDGPFRPGVGTSSLLAMLVPNILQMARGLSEPRTARSSSISSAVKGTEGSDKTPPQATNGESRSLSPGLTTAQEFAPDQVQPIEQQIPCVVEKNLHGESTNGTSSDCGVSSSSGSIAHGEKELLTEHDRGFPGAALPRPVHQVPTGKEFEETFDVNKEKGPLKAPKKEEDRIDELAQRLDRLETICLRMESSLNTALENIDKMLKARESGGPERMTPTLGQPVWGPGVDSGSFLSATSVYVPTAFTCPGTPSLMDVQLPMSMCSAADVSEVESCGKGLSSIETPLNPSVSSSTPPPSVPPAVPFWPLSSWPQNGSLDSSSNSLSHIASFISKNGLMNLSSGSLQSSEHPSNGGETYWESRTSDESESDISSDSEQTSYADNCEDAACGCCPESQSSSPTKPAQTVDSALASALSAFSASVGALKKGLYKEDEFHGEEESDGDDSFTSEEQVPLVELDSFPCNYETEEVVPGDAETVFMHGYEAIPLSSDKDLCDVSVEKGILEENFWSSEMEGNNPIVWQVGDLELLEQEIADAMEESFGQTEEGTPMFESSSAVFVRDGELPTLRDLSTDDLLSGEREGAINETKKGDDVEAVRETRVQDPKQNPFMHELLQAWKLGERAVFETRKQDPKQNNFMDELVQAWKMGESGENGHMSGAPEEFLEQSDTEERTEIARTLLSSYLAFRDGSKPLDSHDEMMMLQEGILDEWNWFTSEFSPFSSLVEVRDLSEDAPTEKEDLVVQTETVDFLDGISSQMAPSHMEPWSLLDDDISIPGTTEQFDRNMYGQDWDWHVQKSQWSLMDEYPPSVISGDKHPEVGSLQDDSDEKREPRSLLDEDICLPSGNVPDVDQDKNLFSSQTSIEGNLNLNDVILSSVPVGKATDVDQDVNLFSTETLVKGDLNFKDATPDVDQNTNVFSSSTSVEDPLNIFDGILPSFYKDVSHSPAPEASRSNPFEDERKEALDLTQGVSEAPLVSLEEFEEEVHEPEASEPEGTQSLLFHLNL